MKRTRKRIRQPKIGTPLMRNVILAFFAVLIIVADVSLIFFHGREFSERENRVLQQAPALTASSLTSGKFMTQEENFVSDQFFLRDTWISMKLFLDRLSGKAESNDVFLGKQGYLLEKPVKPDQENLDRNLNAISKMAESTHLPVVMSLIPGAAWVCDQLLPNQAPVENVGSILQKVEETLSPSVQFVDVTQTLKEHKTEDLYYKSDHHWKSLGACYAFESMADDLGISETVEDYAVMPVTYDFSGTMASNSGAADVKDSIEIYVPLTGDAVPSEGSATEMERAMATDLLYVVEYTDTMEKSATIYDSEALEQKDKYQVFMGGNHPLINIKTNRDNERNLLMLKDSYANTFIQFLLPYYSSLTIIDPRYYSDDLKKVITNNEITDVLILYSENNFMTDNSLFGVLEDMETEPMEQPQEEIAEEPLEEPAPAEAEPIPAEEDYAEEYVPEEEYYEEEYYPEEEYYEEEYYPEEEYYEEEYYPEEDYYIEDEDYYYEGDY